MREMYESRCSGPSVFPAPHGEMSSTLPSVVCLESAGNHSCFPCRHLCVCEACSRLRENNVSHYGIIDRCPSCDREVALRQNLFLIHWRSALIPALPYLLSQYLLTSLSLDGPVLPIDSGRHDTICTSKAVRIIITLY